MFYYCSNEFCLFFLFQFFHHVLFPLEREAEIYNLEVEGVLFEEKEIFGFEVPMSNVLSVAVIDSIEDLFEDFTGVNL